MRFFWPGFQKDVKEFCASCPECQLTRFRSSHRATLMPLPLVNTPFECVGVFLVGPLDPRASRCWFILVLVAYAVQYPEAVVIHSASSQMVASELLKVFSRVGIPREVLIDHSAVFMSHLPVAVCALLKVRSVKTSVYHPQMNSLVEMFNWTLKDM